jgi:hypothetical protein
MQMLTRLMIAVCLMAPTLSRATNVWSGCETITGVSNYTAVNDSVILALSPGLSGCSPIGVTGAMGFEAGQNYVTSTTINSFLATALAAFVAGQQVMVYYDNSTSNCWGAIISVGGYGGECP